MRFQSTCRALGLAALTTLLSSNVLAQAVDDNTRNAARSLAGQGKEALEKADYERARDLFHRAYTLVPAPTIALYEGRALTKLRRFVEAEEAFMRAARTSLDAESPEPFRKAVHDAEEDLAALQAKMPKVIIVTSGAGASDPGLTVSLDGRPLKSALVGVEMPIDPGSHTLSAVVPGGAPSQVSFTAAEKQRQKVELVVQAGHQVAPTTPPVSKPRSAPEPLAPEAAPSPSPWHARAGFIAGGVGVAGVVTGIVTGLMAGSRYKEAERECPDQHCVQGGAGWDKVESFRTLRTVSTVGYIVGGVGIAAGTTLLLTAPRKSTASAQARSVNLWVGPASVGLLGAF